MSKDLDGVRVIDMSTMAIGPLCTSLLGEKGAEIVKVEPKRGGDPLRYIPLFPKVEIRGETVSLPFLSLNAGKRSVTISFRKGKGREHLLSLIRSADVLVENFKPGAMAEWGLDDDTLHSVNPRLIVVHISSYGQNSPLSQSMFHESNLTSMVGILDGLQKQWLKSNTPAHIPGMGLSAANACAFDIITSLFSRFNTNRGTVIDFSIVKSFVRTQGVVLTEMHYEKSNSKNDKTLTTSARNGFYQCKDDGWVCFAAVETRLYESFLKEVGLHHIIKMSEEEQLLHLKELFKTRDKAEWGELFYGTDCCLTPVNSTDEALSILELSDVMGKCDRGGENFIILGHAPNAGPPPKLGEHNHLYFVE